VDHQASELRYQDRLSLIDFILALDPCVYNLIIIGGCTNLSRRTRQQKSYIVGRRPCDTRLNYDLVTCLRRLALYVSAQ